MRLQEFIQLAESFGADISRWPEGKQLSARKLALDKDAAKVLEQAATLDRALDSYTIETLDESFKQRMLTLHVPMQQETRQEALLFAWLFQPAWQRSMALVAMGILGFVLGTIPMEFELATVPHHSTMTMEGMVLGPTQYNEVML